MNNSSVKIIMFLTFVITSVSCSHQSSQNPSDRSLASDKCFDSIKIEYHSYFDQVEKCIEKP